MTIAQWHAKVENMTANELKAHIEAFDTQLADMDTHGHAWPASFEYHCVLQQKRDCLASAGSIGSRRHRDTTVVLFLRRCLMLKSTRIKLHAAAFVFAQRAGCSAKEIARNAGYAAEQCVSSRETTGMGYGTQHLTVCR